MKGGKYKKTLAKIWVEGIIRIGDIRGNVFTQIYRALYGDAMLELIRMSSNMADGNQKHLLPSFATKPHRFKREVTKINIDSTSKSATLSKRLKMLVPLVSLI